MAVPTNIVQSGQSKESLMRAIITRTMTKATKIPLIFIAKLYGRVYIVSTKVQNIIRLVHTIFMLTSKVWRLQIFTMSSGRENREWLTDTF